MKKRQIKKLRERISKFIEFEIQESKGLFGIGDFSESYPSKIILAEDHYMALTRYITYKKRKTKEICDFSIFDETSQKRGKVRVKNTKTGFKKYFK